MLICDPDSTSNPIQKPFRQILLIDTVRSDLCERFYQIEVIHKVTGDSEITHRTNTEERTNSREKNDLNWRQILCNRYLWPVIVIYTDNLSIDDIVFFFKTNQRCSRKQALNCLHWYTFIRCYAKRINLSIRGLLANFGFSNFHYLGQTKAKLVKWKLYWSFQPVAWHKKENLSWRSKRSWRARAKVIVKTV